MKRRSVSGHCRRSAVVLLDYDRGEILKSKWGVPLVFLAVLAVTWLLRGQNGRPNSLKVSYGAYGVQQISYGGVLVEDLGKYPNDAFHIWHMKMTDLQGNVNSGGQSVWGENRKSRTWDISTRTWTYQFDWGLIQLQFVQNGNDLDMNVTEKNLPHSGMILDGAVIYPFALHPSESSAKPQLSLDAQIFSNTAGPAVTVADLGSDEVVSVAPEALRPLYSGFLTEGPGASFVPFVSGTTPDGLPSFAPHFDRPVLPGQTDKFTVSLRFAPKETSLAILASDAYANWARTWPSQLSWPDRRPVGTVYLASSPSGNFNRSGGAPNNPRRYLSKGSFNNFDLRSPAGLASFQARILQQAKINVVNMHRLGAQGSITWDIEGEEYPQSTSYVCEPDNIATIAPEMESLISDRISPYAGMKLDDAYFKIMTSAGFRVGVCVRPQHFTLSVDGTARQVDLVQNSVELELTRKIKFAHDRWGATLFYIDSMVDAKGATLGADIVQRLQREFPDSLLIPEQSTPKYYAYTAPLQTFLFHGDLGTDPILDAFYPHAFSVNLINDVDPRSLSAAIPQLAASVHKGDILMGHVDYWQANDPTIVAIYRVARASR